MSASRKRFQTAPAFNTEKYRRLTPSTPKSSTKITDLNDDCLEYMFRKLKIADLLNISTAMKHFKPTADLVFKSKYSDKSVYLLFNAIFSKDLQEGTADITIWNIPNQLNFLRNFGHLINRLEILWLHSSDRNHKSVLVEQYINKYCADSLIEILFDGSKNPILSSIDKPFTKMHTVTFRDELLPGSFGDKIPQLIKWLPEIRDLSLRYCKTNQTVAKCIEVHFPHMQKLSLKVGERYGNFSNVAEVLRLNPQLEYLELCIDIEPNLLRKDMELLTFPESVELFVVKGTNGLDVNSIHLENVKVLKICGEFRNFPFYSKIVHEIEINHKRPFEHFDELSEFIQANKSLKVLRMDWYVDSNSINWKNQLAEASMDLEEVSLQRVAFSVEEVVEFVGECKNLKKFTFEIDDYKKCDELSKRLEGEWAFSQLTNYKRCIILERINQPIIM